MEGDKRLSGDFFMRDVLEVAPGLIGKDLVIRRGNMPEKYMITETEAYRGIEDKACHASRGETPRNRVMFGRGGRVYVYLI
ncbi:MAG: DNA-3-methyladenine glycosylase, partial [Bacteroidales bacterium]|nr:DNA-3-methyladenine glycosylase [Bacteroidales bacterium]